jgi:transcriptional regulator of acetoin/glycerol metabolism
VKENGTRLILLGPWSIDIVPARRRATVGRGPDVDVIVKDKLASRRHLAIDAMADGAVVVEDLGSRNGSRVDGKLLVPHRPTRLEAGSICAIGAHIAFVARDEGPRWVEPSELRASSGAPGTRHLVLRAEGATLTASTDEGLDDTNNDARNWAAIVGTLAAHFSPHSFITRENDGSLALVARGPDTAAVERASLALARLGLHVAESFEPPARPDAPAVVASTACHPFDLRRVAESDITVLVTGETGVGKEVVARNIHAMSKRAGGKLVVVNCAAIAESLFESELFGHERGAFTGALVARQGFIETADGGTLFLDEVGELPIALQAKLLRVLDERTVVRVGSVQPRPVDVRFVAATLRNLPALVAEGRFRDDLYYRLSGVTVRVAPLRERTSELPSLVEALLARSSHPRPRLTEAAMAALRRHTFPGNVRELRAILERAMLCQDDGVIDVEHLVFDEPDVSAAPTRVQDDSRRARITSALDRHAGNQTKAAEELGVSRRTLTNWLNELGLPRPRKR